jgi:hypothetical protein
MLTINTSQEYSVPENTLVPSDSALYSAKEFTETKSLPISTEWYEL